MKADSFDPATWTFINIGNNYLIVCAYYTGENSCMDAEYCEIAPHLTIIL